jgi:5-methylthioadenosine/S-adenosylhomocysteine deaminase
MHRNRQFSRRGVLVGTASIGAAGLAGLAASDPAAAAKADAKAKAVTAQSAGVRLPTRGNYLIQGAYVMTMERDVGDIADGSVHVKDGEIVAVGKGIKAPGAQVIDGRGTIVLPGLVETHWHMWNTLLRSMSGDKPDFGYFRTTAAIGRAFQPDDMYKGTRLAAAEAVHSGITFVHDWCHNIRAPEYARADLRALKESGLRARFSYGPMQAHDNKQPIDLADLEKLKTEWDQWSDDGLITLGMAWRGHGGNNPATAVPMEVWKAEFAAAQRMGLPVTVHASGSKGAAGQIDGLNKAGMVTKDVQIIHAVYATPEEIRAMKASGASVSISPFTELRIGFGLPQTSAMLDAGIPLGLSVDTVELSGNADMFAIMKLVQNLENGKAESEFKLTARRTLELGTIEGARSMGLADKIGSVKAGKRADIIMVSTRDVNMGLMGDPAHMVVTAAQPANVELVMVDGRILKRNGKLTAMNAAQVAKEAAEANAALRKRANWW